jgi:hypothetical protein
MQPLFVAGALVVVAMCSVVVVAEVDNWAYRIFYGVLLPVAAVFNWLRLRAKGGEVRAAVDWLFGIVLFAIGGLALLAFHGIVEG